MPRLCSPRCQPSAVPCPKRSPPGPSCPRWLTGRLRSPSPGGTPRSPPSSTAPFTNPPLPPAPSPPDAGGPRVAPLGRVSRHSRDDVNSAQPCFYTAPLGKPPERAALRWPGPPGSRLLGQGLRLLQLPHNGRWRGALTAPRPRAAFPIGATARAATSPPSTAVLGSSLRSGPVPRDPRCMA